MRKIERKILLLLARLTPVMSMLKTNRKTQPSKPIPTKTQHKIAKLVLYRPIKLTNFMSMVLWQQKLHNLLQMLRMLQQLIKLTSHTSIIKIKLKIILSLARLIPVMSMLKTKAKTPRLLKLNLMLKQLTTPTPLKQTKFLHCSKQIVPYKAV